MSDGLWLSFFSYTVITALSPGPNNILALNAASNYGMRKSQKLLLGIYLGFFCVMILCGAFSAVLSALLPHGMAYMNYIGAAYILWLAWHIATNKPMESEEQEHQLSFTKGFLLQFINVKIILWGITAFLGFVLPYYHSWIASAGFIFLLALIGNGATHVWAMAGVVFNLFLQKYWQSANVIMALLLVYSAINLIIE